MSAIPVVITFQADVSPETIAASLLQGDAAAMAVRQLESLLAPAPACLPRHVSFYVDPRFPEAAIDKILALGATTSISALVFCVPNLEHDAMAGYDFITGMVRAIMRVAAWGWCSHMALVVTLDTDLMAMNMLDHAFRAVKQLARAIQRLWHKDVEPWLALRTTPMPMPVPGAGTLVVDIGAEWNVYQCTRMRDVKIEHWCGSIKTHETTDTRLCELWHRGYRVRRILPDGSCRATGFVAFAQWECLAKLEP